ncbi:DUF3035 domain-containing protein [Oleispirillum naphthae]|uniref:DUF3035 domain-containing protein n=1 Tax=Oleispirillum naphthae TaxID=2838853 RepID=UPI0030824AED
MTQTVSNRRLLSAAPRLGGRLLVLAALFGLAACGDVKQQLGFNREAPDEFTVLSRAPLSIPPDFALRPPQPGTARPQEGTEKERAKAALLGRSAKNPRVYARELAADTRLSSGEKTVLLKAGANEAESDIRDTVDRETSTLAKEKASFTDYLVFWEDRSYKGSTVDAAKESQRIRENMALGRALSEGEPPKIQRQSKGILEGIF